MNDYNVTHKQIEDIIDAKKESGQYDILVNSLKPFTQNSNIRYAYTAPTHPIDEFLDEFVTSNTQGDNNNEFQQYDLNHVGPTDSEITLIRVKREGSQFLRDTHSKAIPGDGTHLQESPSLVNLATLMVSPKQCFKSRKNLTEQEYLVPLSSWEPVEQAMCQDSTDTPQAEDRGPKQESVKTTTITERRSNSSFKELFRCFMFWKRDRRENGNVSDS